MSALRANNIQTVSGVNHFAYKPGQIVEYLTSPCDGSNVTGISETYTWPSVTVLQNTTTTLADITGSNISYIPPPGTSKVVYKFDFMQAWNSTQHSIQHHRFFIDNNEVVYARNNRSADYFESRMSFEWTINIGGSPDFNTGRQNSWTSAKTLKMQSRRYGTNGALLHATTYWEGTGSNQFSMPTLTLIAIA
jgi:hypothetical protein